MQNINSVVVTGNLTRDPELRSTEGGTKVCNLRIAVNGRRKNANEEWVDRPNYFNVTVWGAQGESCAELPVQGPAGRRPGPARLPRARHRRRSPRVRLDRRRSRPVPRHEAAG